jgi:tetratricopeptide (TPR) repeat protein
LLGEAQWTLAHPQARRTHQRALRELGPDPQERMPKLWAARIHARLGESEAADAIYRSLLATNPADAEAALAFAEMHAQAREWDITQAVLQAFLAHVPDHVRAREMLAWVYEARGRLGDELQLRRKLVQGDASAQSVRDYGRALERSGDWAGALAEYRRAAALPDGQHDRELARALDRVEHRMSFELATGVTGRTDPTANDVGVFAGFSAPWGRASHWSLSAVQTYATSTDRDVYSGEICGAAVLHHEEDIAIVGAKVGAVTVEAVPAMELPRRNLFAPAAFGSLTYGAIANHLTLAIDGELGALWRETPRAVFEAGRVDDLSGRFYVSALSRHLIIDTGAQARHLQLTANADTPEATQLLMWTGADAILWTDFAHEARGQILDNALLRPTFVADSGTLSYRHYELFGNTDQMFASRIALANRAVIDEMSFTYRKVARHGTVTAEAVGGFGRDWARGLFIERGALALWLAPTAASRLSLSFDLARESVRGFAGQRRTGMVSYHVDL